MAYLGTPIDTTNQFQSLQGKRFSGDGSTTAFTLDIAPSSVFDIEVFVENVRQDPNSAYGISGTTLTFTGAPPSGTNNIYVVHQAKAVGTIDVPASGVVPASLASNILTGQTDIGAAITDSDLLLVDDGAGGTLRKTAASRLKTYIGDNTPAFFVNKTSNQTLSNATDTKITFDTVVFDTDNAYASDKFTVPTGKGGKYFIASTLFTDAGAVSNYQYGINYIYVNGARKNYHIHDIRSNAGHQISLTSQLLVDLSAGDYVEIYGNISDLSGSPFIDSDTGNAYRSYFYGYKLIGA